MKILKSIILDKLKEKSSVGASIFESIGKSKWKNDILNDKDVMFLAAKKGISLSKIENSKLINNEKFLHICLRHLGLFDNLEYLFKIKCSNGRIFCIIIIEGNLFIKEIPPNINALLQFNLINSFSSMNICQKTLNKIKEKMLFKFIFFIFFLFPILSRVFLLPHITIPVHR